MLILDCSSFVAQRKTAIKTIQNFKLNYYHYISYLFYFLKKRKNADWIIDGKKSPQIYFECFECANQCQQSLKLYICIEKPSATNRTKQQSK